MFLLEPLGMEIEKEEAITMEEGSAFSAFSMKKNKVINIIKWEGELTWHLLQKPR